MYSIPKTYNLNRLKNTKITQICFTLNTVSIYFEKIGFVSLEGSFSFLLNGKKNSYDEICPITTDFNLLKLLDKEVVNVYTNEKLTDLTLVFEEDMVLELIGNEMYESYVLNIDEKKIIV